MCRVFQSLLNGLPPELAESVSLKHLNRAMPVYGDRCEDSLIVGRMRQEPAYAARGAAPEDALLQGRNDLEDSHHRISR